jgi:hypothetical protein
LILDRASSSEQEDGEGTLEHEGGNDQKAAAYADNARQETNPRGRGNDERQANDGRRNHDGRLLTLDDTVEFFNLILELKLTAKEKKDLNAFLQAL